MWEIRDGAKCRVPKGSRDSTHSADVDYAELLPSLFELKAGSFYVALAGEKNPERVLAIIRDCLKPNPRVFVGVVAPIDPHIETPEEVRDRVMLSGYQVHVSKPIEPHELIAAVASLTGRMSTLES